MGQQNISILCQEVARQGFLVSSALKKERKICEMLKEGQSLLGCIFLGS